MKKRTNNFDHIAPAYDFLASLVFGKALRNAQTLYLSRIPKNSNILILGGGTGWLLKRLLQQQHAVRRIDYVETSSKMIRRAKKILTSEELKKVHFILGDENNVKRENHYDAIITFFILDLFKVPRLHKIFSTLDKALKPSGLWLFADFQGEGNKRWWQKVLILSMYQFFRWVSNVEGETLPDFNYLFQENRFSEIAGKTFYGDFIGAKVYGKEKNKKCSHPNPKAELFLNRSLL